MKITAAVTEETGGPFVIQELELGALAPDEVLVEVAAAGICHTDLIVRDQWLPDAASRRSRPRGCRRRERRRVGGLRTWRPATASA